MPKNSRGPYDITFKVIGAGRDGGLGPKKSVVLYLSKPSDAKKKMRQKNSVIISVLKAR